MIWEMEEVFSSITGTHRKSKGVSNLAAFIILKHGKSLHSQLSPYSLAIVMIMHVKIASYCEQ